VQLSKEEFFHFSHVEVFAVGDEPEKEDDGNTRCPFYAQL
jgi:hypothetical protein